MPGRTAISALEREAEKAATRREQLESRTQQASSEEQTLRRAIEALRQARSNDEPSSDGEHTPAA